MLRSWLKKDKAKPKAATLVAPDIPGILSIRSVDDLLAGHKGKIVQIDELAGLSEPNFNRYYLHAIRNFARFVQLLPASEVHHHAGPGGMLAHTLEVCVNALKIRRSYLLSESGGAEEIAAKQDLWTYAVFLAALSHDLAKVAVDQSVTVYDADRKPASWSPWDTFLDDLGLWYRTEFQRGRQYRLHEKASLLLIHRIIPSYALNWLSSDRHIFEQWLACVSGDIENASSIGEIVGAADSKSVATNLGADSSRMPTVRTKPLHEKMLTALRHLLNEGELPLNRNGAAGWVSGDDCWLVSKRTVDEIRNQLTQEGHSGIPTKNGRMFDILQEHAILIPYGEKAIWPAIVEGDGWHNKLTMIRIAVAKIWNNPENRPDNFDGRIVPAEMESVNDSGTDNDVQPVGENHTDVPNENSENKPTNDSEPVNEETSFRYAEESSSNSKDAPDGYDLMDFLPTDTDSLNDDQEIQSQDKKKPKDEPGSQPQSLVVDKTQKQPGDVKAAQFRNRSTDGQSSVFQTDSKQDTSDPVEQFFSWLRSGIQKGEIKTNRPKARVHVVKEGVALITPGIFQDYALTQKQDKSEWTSVQKKVLKKNWHMKDERGLNVITYKVEGSNKSAKVNVILLPDTSRVFRENEPPRVNPRLIKANAETVE